MELWFGAAWEAWQGAGKPLFPGLGCVGQDCELSRCFSSAGTRAQFCHGHRSWQ